MVSAGYERGKQRGIEGEPGWRGRGRVRRSVCAPSPPTPFKYTPRPEPASVPASAKHSSSSVRLSVCCSGISVSTSALELRELLAAGPQSPAPSAAALLSSDL